MKFSYNWLQSFFGEKLPEPKELGDLLTKHSFEVEEVEKKGEDYIMSVDILPNRAHDCLSHYGLARECAGLLEFETRNQKPKASEESDGQNSQLLNVEINGDDLCPRYSAYVIEGVKIADSPDWMKERLESVEQKSINNVVDITNYIVWELGQPLHAFDFDKIKGGTMTIRSSMKGESVETLDEAVRELDGETIIIEDSERLIDLAGIKGGANTQIEKGTKRIILQAAIFDPAHIRNSSQRLTVRTDAAVRYMHGFDPELPPQALARAFELLRETNPDAKIVQELDIYPNPAQIKEVSVGMQYVNDLLGAELSEEEVGDILRRFNFTFEVSDSNFRIQIPSYRLDLEIPEDLIEEIGRIYGYEKIAPKLPRGVLIPPSRNDKVLYRSKARKIMTGFGFSEIYSYSLTPDYGMRLAGSGRESIELLNPVSDEFKYFRMMLAGGMLKSVSKNSRYFDRMKLFEIGNIFYYDDEEVRGEEIISMAIYEAGDSSGARSFYELKGYVDEFLNGLGITDFYYDHSFSQEQEVHGRILHTGRRANIFVDGKFAGFAGEVHPAWISKFDIKGKVYAAELDFSKILQSAQEEHIYEKPSKYPEIVRDISLFVPRDVMVADILNLINNSAGELLRDADLFDIYEGENVPEGLKNIAFHLIFQSYERTLTSDEIDAIMKRIKDSAESEGWEVR